MRERERVTFWLNLVPRVLVTLVQRVKSKGKRQIYMDGEKESDLEDNFTVKWSDCIVANA